MPVYHVLILAGLVFAKQPPSQLVTGPQLGTLQAEVLITEGGSKSHIHDLDGSFLELGRTRCEIQNGKCELKGLKPGTHLPSATLKSHELGIEYRFLNTDAGSLIRLALENENEIKILPHHKSKIIYHVGRYVNPKAIQEENERQARAREEKPKVSPTPLPSLRAEIWVRIEDYERQAIEDEFTGSVLKLGSSTCVVKGIYCEFSDVKAGEHKLVAEKVVAAKAKEVKYRVHPETSNVKIKIDPWTRLPTLENSKDTFRSIIEKIIPNS